MNVFKLSWRNLWRNKRRTLITVASVFFGVILCALMSSTQEGQYAGMINTVVKFYSGYIQIHEKDYWNNKTINNSFVFRQSMIDSLERYPEITLIAPRLEDFALASSGNVSKGAIILGIDPENEDEMTRLSEKIIKGNYIESGDNGVMMGTDLASKLELTVGDTLVLLGQGYHGVSAAGKFPVKAIFKHSNPEMNRQMICMPVELCQKFYSAGRIVTSVVIMVEDNESMNKVLPKLKADFNGDETVMSWEEMFPNMLQQIESDRSSAMVMKVILYLVIGFGIFGTILMMMAERKHEFGVMVACGMPRWRLSLMLLIETIIIGFLGVVMGLIGSLPVVGYFYLNPPPITGAAGEWMSELGFEPYVFFSWQASVFYNQAIMVLVLTALIALIPFFKMLRFKELKALRD